MTFPKVRSVSYLSLAGFLLLVGGLSVAIFAAQLQQDNRTEAASIVNDYPYRKIYCRAHTTRNTIEMRYCKNSNFTNCVSESPPRANLKTAACRVSRDNAGSHAIWAVKINCSTRAGWYSGTFGGDSDSNYKPLSNYNPLDGDRFPTNMISLFCDRTLIPPSLNDTYMCTGSRNGGRCASLGGGCTTSERSDSTLVCPGSTPRVCCLPPRPGPPGIPSCNAAGGVCQYGSCGKGQSSVRGTCDNVGYMVCCTPKPDTDNPPDVPPQEPEEDDTPPVDPGEDDDDDTPPGTPGEDDDDDTPPGTPGGTSGGIVTGDGRGTGASACVAKNGQCQTNNGRLPTVGASCTVDGNQGSYQRDLCKGQYDAAYRCCVPIPNQPPTANAGEDQTINLPTTRVTLNGSGTDPENGALQFAWTKTDGPDGVVIVNPNAAQTGVTGLVTTGIYTFQLQVTDTKGVTKEDVVTINVNPALTTMLEFDVLLSGIGNSNSSGGNKNPKNKKRIMKVEIRDINDESLILATEEEVEYDSASGSYKGEVKITSGLTNGEVYNIWVKLPHSLWNKKTTRRINVGQNQTIPQLTLKNGDANDDGYLTRDDYKIIRDCYVDPDIENEVKNCNDTKKEQADITDDGEVHHLDLSLFFSEMRIQH